MSKIAYGLMLSGCSPVLDNKIEFDCLGSQLSLLSQLWISDHYVISLMKVSSRMGKGALDKQAFATQNFLFHLETWGVNFFSFLLV